jgi:DNA-binding NtrC family response regulator
MMSSTEHRAGQSMRSKERVLVINSFSDTNYRLREALMNLGWSRASFARTHHLGLKRITAEQFGIALFSGSRTDMDPVHFVDAASKADTSTILIALSSNPQVEDIFGILRSGARGVLRLPFALEGLEAVIMQAKQGPPLSKWVFSAPDRNAALAECVLADLHDLTVAMRQAREFDSAARDAAVLRFRLEQSMELATMFAEHTADASLFDRIRDGCIRRSETAASRLGRTRIALKKRRSA